MKELRDYQISAKNQLRESVRAGNKRIVMYAPTGAGKSIMAVDLISSLLERGKRVAFVANRIGLVQQFSEHLDHAGIRHGIIQGQNTHGLHHPVVVCSIQTVARRGLPDCDYVIIDEAHAAANSTEYKNLIFRYNAIYWFGLTATPFAKGMAKPYPELQGKPLFQDIVIAATIRELIDQGSLVDCEIFAPVDVDLTGVRSKRNAFGEMDYNDLDIGKAVDKPELIGDIVSNWRTLAGGKKTVVFATNVAHSRHIVECFVAGGVNAEHIDGYMDIEEKQPILNRYKSGETLIISNVAMLKEGWDVPSCECMILAKPTKSLIAWVQMVGRILRPFSGKTHGIVIDHSGTVHRLGYPTDDLPLELCDGSDKKKSTSDEVTTPKVKKCPKCHFVKKTHLCPNCGFAPEIQNEVETVEGKLSKVEKVSKECKQEWYSGLLQHAVSKNYNPGWAANQYREKFGVWPRGLQDVCIFPTKEVAGWILHKQIAWAAKNKKPKFTVTKEQGLEKISELKAMLAA